MDESTEFWTPAETTAFQEPSPAVAAARESLASTGVHLMPAAAVRAHFSSGEEEWARFASHWEGLSQDRYAAERGTCRLRRYGRFSLTPATGELTQLPDTPFVQPDRSNPLYVDVDRHFDPLTDAFVTDPLLRSVVSLLGHVAGALDSAPCWIAKVHPFRVVATAGGEGQPTPEGRHRDGVTLVSSLLVGRNNASGGRSSVFAPEGPTLLSATLDEPASLLLSDDRRTLHGVSPIRPLDPSRPAHRDVLVTTLTPA
ncbi:2OG-Fe dioxygenase family protein [Streptomyces sp. G7(2002)]|uniref:2OG-Fe dioxygenase family protein n=1 Tax=Streptomyces sp. G7(2002) TaxID=2971798 RepID=UPI00237DA8EB|nr:2OG-Fe dioxygenase family protein [Streptomyces sp. G7(2002)]WDT58482.1 2OG-Fe dioxygenase family protein [Streptomyces sp. G7(2002)]